REELPIIDTEIVIERHGVIPVDRCIEPPKSRYSFFLELSRQLRYMPHDWAPGIEEKAHLFILHTERHRINVAEDNFHARQCAMEGRTQKRATWLQLQNINDAERRFDAVEVGVAKGGDVLPETGGDVLGLARHQAPDPADFALATTLGT